MTRLQKKCVLASVVLHGLLLVVLVFGAAFQPRSKAVNLPHVNFIASKYIEAALAGGGGNPNVARTDELVKGNTTTPVPPVPVTPPVAKPPETPVRPTPPPPTTPQRNETRPPQPQPTQVRPAPAKPTKPADPVKPPTVTRTPTTPPKTIKDLLVDTARTPDKAAKEKADAQAREAARQQAAANRALENRLNSTLAGLKAGYEKGTAVDFHGPGGEAYASWDASVQARYRAAMSGVSDFSDQDYLIVVEVTVARNGRVIESRIVRRSGNAVMDKATQTALDKVKKDGLPAFPDGARESERKFSIDFNLKARRGTG